jgi:ESCRT-II complex subunit VPS25
MVRKNLAVYEPPKQTRAVVLYWRLPEEWAEVLHEWVRAPLPSDPIESPRSSRRFLRATPSVRSFSPSLYLQATKTGQLNTILTFYEISNPPVPSALSGIPESLLRNAISILAKGSRAQLISISDGDGVRFFPRTAK